MNNTRHVFVNVIAASPEKVWRGITDPAFTCQYWHSTRVRSDFKTGSKIEFLRKDDSVGCRGEIIESVFPTRLSYTWSFPDMPGVGDETPSRVTFELEPIAAGTKLTVIHDRFPDGSRMAGIVEEGWPLVLGGLKTLLETGAAVDFSANAA